MVNQAIWLTTTLLLHLPGLQSQSIPALLTCPNRTVTLPDSRGSYNIQHSRDPVSSDTCELTLVYTSNVGSYALLEGVRTNEVDFVCLASQINIGEDTFCIDIDSYTTRIAENQQSTLVITTRANDTNFNISMYLSVYICSGSTNPTSPWSGVVSSLGGGVSILQDDCFTVLSDLPSGARVKLKLLKPLAIKEALVSITGQNVVNVAAAGVAVYVNVSDRGAITIRRTLDNPAEPQIGGFAIMYTVIRCGDIPEIENTTHTSAQPPYLPGSNVQYSCGDHYQFKNESYITCEEKIQGEAVWSDDVRCIPVPWCLEKPQNISRATQTVISENRTISYKCNKGYESDDEPALIVTCSSIDEDRQHWKWNDTNIEREFICNPVQCDVGAIQEIKNGSLNDTASIYNYMDTITYDCEEGFKKNTTKHIVCQSDKTWSAVPGCELVQCTKPSNTSIHFINTSNTNTNLAYGEVITIQCVEGYELKNENWDRFRCSSSGSWVSYNDSLHLAYNETLPFCEAKSESGGESESGGTSKDQEGLSEDEKLYIIIAVVVVVVVALVVVVTFIVLRRGRMANSRQGEQQRGGVATGNIDENPYHDLEGPDVVTSHTVINHSEGAYDRVELDVLNVGAVTGSVKAKPAVDKSTKPKSFKKSKKEEKKAGTAPPVGAENLYGEIKKTQPSPKVKKSQKKQEPEPLYAEAPPVPIKQHGEQEVDLVDNDLYDRSQQPSASNQGNVSAGDGQCRFSDGNAYEDVDKRKTKGYTNTAVDLVANDLYDSMQ